MVLCVPAAPIVGRLQRRVDYGLAVRGDDTRLRRVFANLLDSAVRHGAPPIMVTAARAGRARPGNGHDGGPGTDARFLPHATERF